MKTMKKLFALLLALTMVFGLAATGFAAETGDNNTTGSITVSNANPGEKYNVYRIFNLSFAAGTPSEDNDGNTVDNNKYFYTVSERWADFVKKDAPGATYVDIADSGAVSFKEAYNNETGAAAFAKAALEWLEENEIVADAAEQIAPAATAPATTSTVTFNTLSLGYYLVTTTTGTVCSLDTTNPTVQVEDKNEAPTVEKKVQEGTEWKDDNTAGIGDTVNFQVTVHAKQGATNYILHDKMTEGLEFDENSVKVTVDDRTVETSWGANVAWQLNPNTYECGETDHTFHIVFNNDWIAELTDEEDKDIVITYSATVTEYAKIGHNENDTNENETGLTYGNEQETAWDKTKTYVFELNIWKHYGADSESARGTALSGAKFVLYKNVPDGTADGTTKKVYAQVEDGKLSGWTETETSAATLVSDEKGYILIDGLDAGTYFLTETKAPDGYNKLVKDIEVTIKDDGTITYKNVGDSAESNGASKTETESDNTVTINNIVKVENKSGTELPSTGGMGTTLFYVVGSLMVLGAAVLLVAKKRSNT